MKTALGFFIVLGIFTGIVIFGNLVAPKHAANHPIAVNAESPAHDAVAPAENPTPITTSDESLSKISGKEKANLTENLASLVATSITTRNPAGPADGAFNAQDIEELAMEAVDSSLKERDPRIFTPFIADADIVIDPNADPETYQAATKAIASEVAIPGATLSLTEEFLALGKRFATKAAQLRALPVPPRLAEQHKKAVQDAMRAEKILSAIADYENDPLYALVALRAWKETR